MKMKYLFHGLLASILLITACQEPDDLVRSDSENINILSVKGSLISEQTSNMMLLSMKQMVLSQYRSLIISRILKKFKET